MPRSARGTAVYVLNGPKAPAPFNDSAPPTKPDANQAPGDVVPVPTDGAARHEPAAEHRVEQHDHQLHHDDEQHAADAAQHLDRP